jgi:hypothetical protein
MRLRKYPGVAELKADGPPASYGLRTVSTPDQVHACQTMTEVHIVSIVAKNK